MNRHFRGRPSATGSSSPRRPEKRWSGPVPGSVATIRPGRASTGCGATSVEYAFLASLIAGAIGLGLVPLANAVAELFELPLP
jgi:hypothetical protein